MSRMFSIIVPVYNCQDYLLDCYKSIRDQSYKNFELIFVDDGSIDNSKEMLDKISTEDSVVTTFHRPHIGACAARNYGLKHAIGEYIVYVDCDDELLPDALQTLANIVSEHPNLDMIVYKYVYITAPEKRYGFNIKEGYYPKEDKEKKIIKPHFLNGMLQEKIVLNSCNVCYRRDYLLDHYCKDETIVHGEDWAYSYECLYYAKDVYCLDNKLYLYKCNNIESVMNSPRTTGQKLYDFCKLMFYIGNSFAFEEQTINKRFAQCCLFGISKLILKGWGENKSSYFKHAKTLTSKEKSRVLQMLNHVVKDLELKDYLYAKFLIIVFKSATTKS